MTYKRINEKINELIFAIWNEIANIDIKLIRNSFRINFQLIIKRISINSSIYIERFFSDILSSIFNIVSTIKCYCKKISFMKSYKRR